MLLCPLPGLNNQAGRIIPYPIWEYWLEYQLAARVPTGNGIVHDISHQPQLEVFGGVVASCVAGF